MSDELLTAREAAALLKFSVKGFYEWRRRHKVPSAIAGRVLRFRRTDLLAANVASVFDFSELGRQHARRGRRA